MASEPPEAGAFRPIAPGRRPGPNASRKEDGPLSDIVISPTHSRRGGIRVVK